MTFLVQIMFINFGDTLISEGEITTQIYGTHLDTLSKWNSSDHYDLVYYFTLNPQNLSQSYISKFELQFRGSLNPKIFKQTKISQFVIELEKRKSTILPTKITHSIVQSRDYKKGGRDVFSQFDEFVFMESSLNWRNPEPMTNKSILNASEFSVSADPIGSTFMTYRDEVALGRVARKEAQERLEETFLENLLNSNLGKKDTYLVFWDNHVPLIAYSEMFFNLEPREDREIIFIGNIDYHQWKFVLGGTGLEAFKNFYLPTLFKDVLTEECHLKGAVHLKIDKKGNKHCQDTAFSLEELNGTN